MKFRHFAFFVILILLGVFIVKNAGRLGELLTLLSQVNIWILLFIIPLRYGYYWANTRFYQVFFRLFKKRLAYKELVSGVVSMNFVNTVIPTGGVSGAAFFAQIYRKKITNRESYLAQFFWYIATFLSIMIVLMASYVLLFFSSSIQQASFRIILVIMSLLLFLSVVIIGILINRKVFQKVLFILTRPANVVLRLLRRGKIGEAETERFVHGFMDVLNLFANRPKRALKPFWYAFYCILFELLSIFVVYLAFGKLINPGIIGSAYVFALIFSLTSFFTSGIGAYEATMVGVSVALGVDLPLAVSVTAIYRIIALWLFIPVGLYFYKHQTIDRAE
ncbi:flippase-like domain-containing protein [Candidatus Saccharibacteria bacterium]|nr:flippase-like domain-containing protein [Candidatus Saccharibacteria bacterium]